MFKTKYQKELDLKLQDMNIKLALLIVKVESLQKAAEKPLKVEGEVLSSNKTTLYADYLTPDGKFTTKKKAQEIKDSLISRN